MYLTLVGNYSISFKFFQKESFYLTLPSYLYSSFTNTMRGNIFIALTIAGVMGLAIIFNSLP